MGGIEMLLLSHGVVYPSAVNLSSSGFFGGIFGLAAYLKLVINVNLFAAPIIFF